MNFISTPPKLQDPDGLSSIPDLRRALQAANVQIVALHNVVGEMAAEIGPILAAHVAGDRESVIRALDKFAEARVRIVRTGKGEVH